jgi:hypothetical protein
MVYTSQQRGMTLMSFVIVLAVLGFVAYIGMKLFPVYTEYYSEVKDMNGLASESGVASWPPNQVRDRLFRRFYVSYVKSVKQEHVKIARKDGYFLTIKYEVREPLIFNLDFVAKFDKTVELSNQGAGT